VCVLYSLERHCVYTAQSREALCVYCTVYRGTVCVLHSLERHCVCTAQSREALQFKLYLRIIYLCISWIIKCFNLASIHHFFSRNFVCEIAYSSVSDYNKFLLIFLSDFLHSSLLCLGYTLISYLPFCLCLAELAGKFD